MADQMLTKLADAVGRHLPPREVLTSLGDAWATCDCGERFGLTVTDGHIRGSEIGELWRAHVAVALSAVIADRVREAAADPSLRLSGHSGISVTGLRRWADRLGAES